LLLFVKKKYKIDPYIEIKIGWKIYENGFKRYFIIN
jgi:hypothetical protein